MRKKFGNKPIYGRIKRCKYSNRPNQIPAKPRKNRRNNGLRNKSPAPLLREKVKTPLGTAHVNLPDDTVVLATILRAGLPFHQGFLSCLDDAENAFVSAYRKYKDKLNFDIFIEYIASPRIDGKVLVLTDPMLATGGSMELSYKALLTKGTPKDIHIASVIASRQAIDYVKDHFPENTTIWVGAIDDKLDEHSYIVPGLGDAGDLAYGIKE